MDVEQATQDNSVKSKTPSDRLSYIFKGIDLLEGENIVKAIEYCLIQGMRLSLGQILHERMEGQYYIREVVLCPLRNILISTLYSNYIENNFDRLYPIMERKVLEESEKIGLGGSCRVVGYHTKTLSILQGPKDTVTIREPYLEIKILANAVKNGFDN